MNRKRTSEPRPVVLSCTQSSHTCNYLYLKPLLSCTHKQSVGASSVCTAIQHQHVTAHSRAGCTRPLPHPVRVTGGQREQEVVGVSLVD